MMDEDGDSSRESCGDLASACSLSYDSSGNNLTRSEHFMEVESLGTSRFARPETLSAEALCQQRWVSSFPRRPDVGRQEQPWGGALPHGASWSLGPMPGTCLLQFPQAADLGTSTWLQPQAHRPIGHIL